MSSFEILKNENEMSFHERTIAKEIAYHDAWVEEVVRERAEERKRKKEETRQKDLLCCQ